MELSTAEPDVATLVGRIRNGLLDLQPDFQRGQVWSDDKRRRLIDSILRGWQIPPVHVVKVTGEGRALQQVLDGQQRLRAILDFLDDGFAIDGGMPPEDEAIRHLDGLHYSELPPLVRDSVDYYTIRVIELRDYEPEEPYELFYRWNEATVLTAAEKRNALFGEPRHQVHNLVSAFGPPEMSARRLGFSNARMAYDDVVARLLVTIELGSLREFVSAQMITSRFRKTEPFDETTMGLAEQSLTTLLNCNSLDSAQVRLTKASTHTWACALVRLIRRGFLDDVVESGFDELLGWFEAERKLSRQYGSLRLIEPSFGIENLTGELIDMFNDRASARVADVTSVVARDAIVNLFLIFSPYGEQIQMSTDYRALYKLGEEWRSREEFNDSKFLMALDRIGWGLL